MMTRTEIKALLSESNQIVAIAIQNGLVKIPPKPEVDTWLAMRREAQKQCMRKMRSKAKFMKSEVARTMPR